ncbi:MAG: glycoside hydrolase family 65 protein, partial [Bacteroidota bacterium]
LDLHHQPTEQFYRELNLKEGTLTRSFEVLFDEGKRLQVNATRFCSMAAPELGVIRFAVTPVNFNGKLKLTPYLDFDVRNADANYGEKFWEPIGLEVSEADGWVHSRTRKTGFEVCAAMQYRLTKKGEPVGVTPNLVLEDQEDYVAHELEVDLVLGEAVVLEKYAGVTCSRNHDTAHLVEAARKVAADGHNQGFNTLLKAHKAVWAQKWEMGDIAIEGDVAAQQGIRYNIFQLHQTYTGDDPLLNIGPKGFTGEKYGGCTYWDTEAYCLPFYLSTCPPDVARNLLVYRYKHLEKAIENAANLGFSGGAALYPMVTMNGEESHNEWEITFEEIHRNGAIAFAIFNYVRHTDHSAYLAEYGFEVLVAISRF